MTTPTITLIGAGNMGASLLGGLINNGYDASKIWITDPDMKKLEHLQQQFHVQISSHNQDAVKTAEVIILAVKPQILSSVATEIATQIQTHKPLILSIAAGVRVESLQHWLGKNIPIVRAMPNTPALIGCGASALYANSFVSTLQRNLAESILHAVGIAVWLENETHMDAVTALSGSGPAYFFLIIEALQHAAQQLGLPEETAKILTLQTAYGAARMALESHDNIAQLRRNVTSPGGTTEQAIQVLENENIRDIFLKAIQAGHHRSNELADILGKITEK